MGGSLVAHKIYYVNLSFEANPRTQFLRTKPPHAHKATDRPLRPSNNSHDAAGPVPGSDGARFIGFGGTSLA